MKLKSVSVILFIAATAILIAYVMSFEKEKHTIKVDNKTTETQSDASPITQSLIPKKVEDDELDNYTEKILVESAHNLIHQSNWLNACESVENKLREWINQIITTAALDEDKLLLWEKKVFVTAGCLTEIYQEDQLAIDVLVAALASDNNNSQFQHMLGTNYFRTAQDKKAESMFERILESEDSSQELWQKGFGGAVRGKLAVTKLRIVGQGGGQDRARVEQAKTLLEEANQVEGLTAISPVRHGQLAYAELALGNFEAAIWLYEIALKLTDDQKDIWDRDTTLAFKAEYTMGLGQTLYISNNKEFGIQKMDEAINYAKSSNKPTLLNSLIMIRSVTIGEMTELPEDTSPNIPIDDHITKELKK